MFHLLKLVIASAKAHTIIYMLLRDLHEKEIIRYKLYGKHQLVKALTLQIASSQASRQGVVLIFRHSGGSRGVVRRVLTPVFEIKLYKNRSDINI